MEASSPSEQEAWYNAIEAEMFVFFVSTIREILSVYLFFMLGRWRWCLGFLELNQK